MIDFQKNSFNVARAQRPTLSARKALDGIWWELYFAEIQPTQHGVDRMVLSGQIQFNPVNSQGGIIWPAFQLKTHPEQFLNKEGYNGLTFGGFTSYAQIEAFEKYRNGADLSVVTGGSLQVANPDGSHDIWLINGFTFRLPSQSWLEELERGGYNATLFLALNFPSSATVNPDSAYRYLLSAKDYFDKALYKPCVADLRCALEAITATRDDKKDVAEAEKGYCHGDRKEMSFESRLMIIRSAVFHACHRAHHASSDLEAERREAKALLACTAALLELYPEPDRPIDETIGN